MQIGRNFDEIFHFLMRGQCLSYAVHTSPGMMNEVKFRVDMLNRSLKSTYRGKKTQKNSKRKKSTLPTFLPKTDEKSILTHKTTPRTPLKHPKSSPNSPKFQIRKFFIF